MARAVGRRVLSKSVGKSRDRKARDSRNYAVINNHSTAGCGLRPLVKNVSALSSNRCSPPSIDIGSQAHMYIELTSVTLNAIRTFAPLSRPLSDVFWAPGERAPADADSGRIR